MSNTIGRFDFRLIAATRRDSPFNPIVRLVVATWSTLEGDKRPVLSANLATPNEIDYHISALKNDLDEVGERAKSALLQAHKLTLEAVRGKGTDEPRN